jgi:hypothetical protein
MAESKHAVERPLSPHLGIYRMQINMVMSIVHRLTGAALYFGTLLLAAWLIAAATGEQAFAAVSQVFAHPLGKLVLITPGPSSTTCWAASGISSGTPGAPCSRAPPTRSRGSPSSAPWR